jgi:glycosyltransferase involved in cell wall biosynthesis
MKVLHIITSLKRGGAEVFLSNLLPLLKYKGINVSLVSMTNEIDLADILRENKIPVYTLNFKGNIYKIKDILKAIQNLKAIILKEKPDIIHSHLYMADLITQIAVGKRYPLISTIHNIDKWWSEKYRIKSRIKTFLDSFSGKLTKSYYIAVSESVRNAACKSLRIPENRIRVVYNGINLQNFTVKDYRNESIINSPIIIQVGRFYKEKGHETSMKAMLIIRKYYPKARLLLVGDGPLRSFIENEIKRLDLIDNIELLGIREDIPELLLKADIFWMPSEWEGLPIACLEAMASGLPVIASAVGGLPEIIVDGETGYLIPKGEYKQLAEYTIRLLSDFSLRKKMGLRGRQTVERKFSLEKTADEYINVYKSIKRKL